MNSIANRLHSFFYKAISGNKAEGARIATQIKVTVPDQRSSELQTLRLGRKLDIALRTNANSPLHTALQKAVPVYNASQPRPAIPSYQERLALALRDHKHAVPRRPAGLALLITPTVNQADPAAVPSTVEQAALTTPARTPSPVKSVRFPAELEMPQSPRYNADQAAIDNKYQRREDSSSRYRVRHRSDQLPGNQRAEESPSRYRVRDRTAQLPGKAHIDAPDCSTQVMQALDLSGLHRVALRNAVSEVLEDFNISRRSWRQTAVTPADFPRQNQVAQSRIF